MLEQKFYSSNICATDSKSASSSNAPNQLSGNITKSKSSNNGDGQATIPEVVVYHKNGERVCCINYHEDATSYYKSIIECPLKEGLPDMSCTASEPLQVVETNTEIIDNFNFVESVICPEEPFSGPFHQQLPRSVSDYECQATSNDTDNVTSAITSPMPLILSASDNQFSEPNSHYLLEFGVTSKDQFNITTAISAHVKSCEISPANENNVDIYSGSFSLDATTNCGNVSIMFYCYHLANMSHFKPVHFCAKFLSINYLSYI